MKKNSPIVSVIMPMRNAEAYISQAVNSILSQSCRELELLVIDDQSTDQSRPIIEEILTRDNRLKLLSGEGKGIAAAKNIGVKHASGEIIMFCDSDDYFTDARVENQVNWLNQHPEVGAVCGSFAMTDHNGNNSVALPTGDQAYEITKELLSGKTRTHLCTFAVRRGFTELIGGFREFFVSAEDIDFQLRLAEVCNVFYEPNVVYYYRLHDSSIVHTQTSTQRLFYEATARSFRQQRAENGEDDLQAGYPPQIPVGYGLSVDAKTQLQGALIGTAWQLHQNGQKLKAFKTGLNACRIRPGNFIIWKSFVMLFLK
jgi:glycosyltransferase involved in cell wall biosynthesis